MLLILFLHLVLRVSGGKEKIFGGRLAKKGEFPFIVGIRGEYFCGGTLVTLSKVLSAAHCFVNETDHVPFPVSYFLIYGGSIIIPFYGSEDVKRQERKVKKYKVHEKHKEDYFNAYNDIALAELVSPFVQNEVISTAKFPSRDKETFQKMWNDVLSSNKKCIGLGWGKTMMVPNEDTGELEPGALSEELKAVELKPLTDQKCNQIYRKYLDYDWIKHKAEGEVCLGSENEGESPCLGDSGGPLVCDGSVFALLRGGQECGNASLPNAYILYGPFLEYFGLSSPPTPKPSHTSCLEGYKWFFFTSFLFFWP